MSDRRRLLLVTNDFPPRQGGIQSMLFELVRRLPPADVAVYCSNFAGADQFDAELAFPVRRHPTGLLVPTPVARRRVRQAALDFGSEVVWFGAAAPLALLAPALREAGVRRIVASTHGHEVGWARLPVARQALRRIGNHADVITYLSDYTRTRLEPALGPRPQVCKLTPGVDPVHFRPGTAPNQVRLRYQLGDRPVVACISRLVTRKGQDVLIDAWPSVLRTHPAAVLLLVGAGPRAADLRRRAGRLGIGASVIFAGAAAPEDLAEYYRAADVFAMPCRTRRAGLDVEGLGIVYLEASASGVPVIAGDSGGAPDAVRAGETGFVVDGRDVAAVAGRITSLLADPGRAQSMGAAGRRWVIEAWQWDQIAARLAALLEL